MKKALNLMIVLLMFQFVQSQSLNTRWLNQLNLGVEAYAINDYFTALKHFTDASNLVPTDTTAYIYLIDCAYKTQNASVLFKSFDKLMILGHESARNYYLAIQACVDIEKDYQKAVQYAEAAKQKFGNNPQIRMADIMLYYKYGDFEAAKTRLLPFVEQFPNDKRALNLLISIALDIKKDYSEAIRLLELAQQRFPDDPEFPKKEVNIYIENHQMEAAEKKFRKLIELNPDDAKHYYNLSLIMYNKGDYEQSVALASKAIELNPDFLEAIFNVGTFYYHRGLQYNQALTKMTPYQYTYQGQGREIEEAAKSYLEAAKPYFEKAIQLNTNELGAFENLNTINVLLNNIEETRQLTEPYFTDLENEEKHKVYPDYELLAFEFLYSEQQNYLSKGQQGQLKVQISNTSGKELRNLQIRLFQPFVNPMLNFKQSYPIDSLAAKSDTTLFIPFEYLLNNPATVGMEKAEGTLNRVRFFVTGPDEKYTDLKEIALSMGKTQLLASGKTANSSETIDIEFTPNARAKNLLLLIGINDYAYWPKLTNAVSDAQLVKQVLKQQYEVDAENVFELYDNHATKNNMINELIKIKGELSPQDNLIIYYAGHGDYNPLTDEGAWIPYDAPLNAENQYLDNTTLLNFLNALDTRHTFLIADACFSGSLFVNDDEMTYKPNNDKIKSRWGFTSGNIEYVADGAQGEGSPFAQYLVEALKENQREYIAVTELISYVKFKVRNSAVQTPIGRPLKISGNEGGEFLLYSR